MRFNILSYLFFIIIITFQNTQIVSATNGIKYLPTTNPDITYYKFKECNKDSNNNNISYKNFFNSEWAQILKTVPSIENLEENWDIYQDFFENCESFNSTDSENRIKKEDVDYKKCNINKGYLIPQNIKEWESYCGLEDRNISEINSLNEPQEKATPKTKKKDSKYAESNDKEVVNSFNEKYGIYTQFINTEYVRIRDRTYSNQDVLDKEQIINSQIENYKSVHLDLLQLLQRADEIFCYNENDQCEDMKTIRGAVSGVGQVYCVSFSFDNLSMEFNDWEKFKDNTEEFCKNFKTNNNIKLESNDLLEEYISEAKRIINEEKKRQIQKEKAREAEEKARKEAEEQAKKEAEEQAKKEAEKEAKKEEEERILISEFNNYINELNLIDQDSYNELNNSIESLNEIKETTDYEALLNLINERLKEEKAIRKNITNTSNQVDKLIRSLDNANYLKLNLPVEEKIENAREIRGKIDGLIEKLDDVIDNLENKRISINKSINSKETWNVIFNVLYYVVFFLIVLATGIFSYRIGKNKNSNTRDDNNNKSLRDLNLKIKLLEEKNESLEKIISKNLKSQQQTSAKISTKKDEVKEKSPEEVKLEEERNRDMAYDDALENPNLINEFVKMYGVIGLDKGSKVARGENAILKRDDKPIERCNFWGMPNPNDPSGNKWIIFPGRTLQSNAAALTADDSRYGREILSGIFNFEVGTTFRVITFAQANKDQDGFKIIGQGQLVLPK